MLCRRGNKTIAVTKINSLCVASLYTWCHTHNIIKVNVHTRKVEGINMLKTNWAWRELPSGLWSERPLVHAPALEMLQNQLVPPMEPSARRSQALGRCRRRLMHRSLTFSFRSSRILNWMRKSGAPIQFFLNIQADRVVLYAMPRATGVCQTRSPQ